MENKKIVINVSGKGCSGKSTLSKKLSERISGIYIVSYDKLKWQLGGYNRDLHRPIIKELTIGLFEVVCRQGIPIIIDGFSRTEELYKKYLQTMEENGYKFLPIKLEAPPEVLLDRFRERIASCESKGKKISIMDEDLFIKNNSIKYFDVPNATVFDTSVLSIDEIANKVLDLYNEKA